MAREITWQAPEFMHYPKSAAWFIVLTAVAAGFAGYFLFRKDFLTAAMFVLLYVVVFFFSRKKPKIITVKLAGQGVSVGGTRLPWQKIKAFWIVYNPPEVKTLNLETAAYLNPVITLQLAEADPGEIREFLLEFIPEEPDREEQLADKIGRKLRF